MRVLYQSILSTTAIRQRPHFMAEGLASHGCEVFWFYAAVAGKCRFRRWGGGREIAAIPFASRARAIDLLNRVWTGLFLRRIRPDAVVATNPITWNWLPRRLRVLPTVYDCMDDHASFFSGRRQRRLLRTEAALVASSRRIVATSSVVADRLRARYGTAADSVEVIPNAYNPADFLRPAAPLSLQRPAIVYTGTLGHWFDWNSVLAAAVRHAEWTFHLVGPMEAAVPDLPDNIHLVGPLSHSQAVDWMRNADALMLPFVRSPLVDAVDPVKLYEYVASGRPVVTAHWPLLDAYGTIPSVSFYGDGRPLQEALERALASPPPPPPPSFLEANIWDIRARRLAEIVREAAA